MKQALEKEVQKIMVDVECPKDFICYKSGFETLGKVKDVGLKGHVQCLEEKSSDCPFSVSFLSPNFCRCPVRIHIAENLGK